ncbi:MAG: RNA 2',3'-cyclic phosphodiesterase [Planctomycetes bacterium]|nr:RNA 2',3'-cyclic phosphodiesterase [Planctomycetota bacterium]
MRAFLAIPLDAELRPRVARTIDNLRTSGADVSWVRPENLHLTLKFLGEVPEDLRLDFHSSGSPFCVELKGVGQFGGRVVWVGLAGNLAPLVSLAGSAEEAAVRAGVPREGRPYAPHLTIGRIRSRRNLAALRRTMERWALESFGPWWIRACVLMRSTRSPQGSIYSVLTEYPLT